MLSTFLELNKKHSDYNPQFRNDGTLRYNMEDMHTTAQLRWLEGSGIFTSEKQAAFGDLLASERAAAEARHAERLERRRIFDERATELKADVLKVAELMRTANGNYPNPKDVLPVVLAAPYNWGSDEKDNMLPVGEEEVSWYAPPKIGYLDISPSGGDLMEWSNVPGVQAELTRASVHWRSDICLRVSVAQCSSRCSKRATGEACTGTAPTRGSSRSSRAGASASSRPWCLPRACTWASLAWPFRPRSWRLGSWCTRSTRSCKS